MPTVVYTDDFNKALKFVFDTLDPIADMAVTDDPRNLKPPCVLIEAPSFDAESANMITLQFPIVILTLGPDNRDGLKSCMSLVAKLVAANIGVKSGQNVTKEYGGVLYTAYEVTIPIGLTN